MNAIGQPALALILLMVVPVGLWGQEDNNVPAVEKQPVASKQTNSKELTFSFERNPWRDVIK